MCLRFRKKTFQSHFFCRIRTDPRILFHLPRPICRIHVSTHSSNSLSTSLCLTIHMFQIHELCHPSINQNIIFIHHTSIFLTSHLGVNIPGMDLQKDALGSIIFASGGSFEHTPLFSGPRAADICYNQRSTWRGNRG